MLFQAVGRPVALLLITVAALMCLTTSALAHHQAEYIDELRIERAAARTTTAYFMIAAVILFAVALTAAPITGGTSVIAAGALVSSLSAGAVAATSQMDVNRYNRRIATWGGY